MLVDSHCHLNYLENPEVQLSLARDAGLSGFLCIGVNEEEFPQVLAIAHSNPDVWATAGVHPEACGESVDLSWLTSAINNNRVVGIGETGLDFSRLNGNEQARQHQLESFAYHLELAGEHSLPVVIHTREARADTLKLMSQFPGVTGVMHCFTEDWEMARSALEMGYYISISGIVTFNNADQVREVAGKVPVDRLLIETDCPWLAPVPHRGKQNQPAFVRDTALYIARLRDISYEEVSSLTTNNFFKLFQKIHA